jgi:hypothetical protein
VQDPETWGGLMDLLEETETAKGEVKTEK